MMNITGRLALLFFGIFVAVFGFIMPKIIGAAIVDGVHRRFPHGHGDL